MIERIIHWSLANRLLVLLAAIIVTGWGVVSLQRTPLDAIPDLSDTQVIIRASLPGQSPQVIEDQVTYPLSTTMLAVPGAATVRGYSFFGDSYVYILFEDGTDLYWARSRVLEYLSQAVANLPEGTDVRLGPDATGVGWVYQYALVDRSGRHDLAQLRSLQDWFLRFELQALPGVAEVASVGGMVKQYQVTVDPQRLRAFGIALPRLRDALRDANVEAGGSVMELAEAEYMIRGRGYLESVEDIERIPVGVGPQGTPILLRDLAQVAIGPAPRRGVAELDGEGEVVGGIVVMRHGENARAVIQRVRERLEQLAPGLPEGVEVVTTYDRSDLIQRAVDNLTTKLVEEFIVVALVCLAFLFHLRSALVAIVSLPLGVLMAFVVMQAQGINANIMSLGGIAIAIGAMVDAAIVMIENAHRHLERWRAQHGSTATGADHWQLIARASVEVGPALFFSLLVITLSFLPVFTLQAQEGRLFAPLAFTKTYAMAAAAGLAITLVPVLMGYFIRGRIPGEQANPLNRFLIRLYRPALAALLDRPRATLALALLLTLSLAVPLSQLGGEFMPELEEGDLLYMPTTLPGVSVGKARELLQQTDRLIATVPEVARVFGKVGRADTATDPAPLTMIETTILLRPKHEWRPGVTLDDVIAELDAKVQFPGLTNAWVQPIKTRIDMLATGIRTPVGVKIAGDDLAEIQRIGTELERVIGGIEGVGSVYAERVIGGRYVEVIPDRVRAARYGLSVGDINGIVSMAVGGMNVTTSVEGRERYPVNLRYPQWLRDDPERLRELPLVTPGGAQLPLGAVAEVRITDGPPMIRSENARLNGWVFVDVRDSDLAGFVDRARRAVAEQVPLPPGYSLTWTGQYEYMQRAAERLRLVVPLTIAAIFILLYLAFRRVGEALLVMLSLPFALVGGFWLLWALGYNLSVAVAVGFIALAGVAAEFGVVMLLYLNHAAAEWRAEGRLKTLADLRQAVMEGAVLRVRPKAMTVAVIFAGLLPIMFGSGAGSDVMRRIAAPMIGGMITAPLLSLFVIPAIYLLWHGRRLPRDG
ncbi:MAG: efflux RND transporter permease subunit [Chromatiales bacterium]|jgi:Cu(I)/Ag(I) efflux system membrane protein CusA/SilA|nr:efflux RND transporter permease subunit [Chromatiales bacterium]MDX9767083.1 efflux RND transporter permease subunit [Ectothiorhodospiraceae bacterium]